MDLQVIEKMTGIVSGIVTNNALEGLDRAYKTATAIEQLRELLTPEYMAPIMKLQGTRLGFKTDQDKDKAGNKLNGYSMEVVKECLIEAVLLGVQPVGNQFNIIKGGCYLTKEGFGYILSNIPGLTWKITPCLPDMRQPGSAAIKMKVSYTHNSKKGYEELDIPVKIDQYSGPDLVIGKAQRKARAWLHTTITGSEAPEWDVQDVDYQTMSTTIKDEPVTAETLAKLYEEKKHLLSAAEASSADRIITNKETASFKKLNKQLSDLCEDK